jgi:threonine/homoserine/homoserine lactone efflux protein
MTTEIMSRTELLEFATVALVLALVPGVDTMMTVRNTLAHGLGAGLVTIAGICCGGIIQASFAAFGISVILLQSATVYEAVKLTGAAYLIYLGVMSIVQARGKGGRDGFAPIVPGERPTARPLSRSYLEGFITNVLNPKVPVFFLAFLPQFIRPGDPVVEKSFLLVGILYAEGISWLVLVALCVARIAHWLLRPSVRRRFEMLTGAVFVALGARIAMEKHA